MAEKKSILEELNSVVSERNKLDVVATRGNHIIKSAINLIQLIEENFDDSQALDLQRRLVNSIKGRKPERFAKLMIQAILHKKEEVYIAGAKEKLGVFVKRLSPKLFSKMIRNMSVT